MGTTVFKVNSYTGCSRDGNNFNCKINTYTLGTRSGKVRIITGQEAMATGCDDALNSCPKWMSTSTYLTMSAHSNQSLLLKNSFAVDVVENYDALSSMSVTGICNVRTVVVINK